MGGDGRSGLTGINSTLPELIRFGDQELIPHDLELIRLWGGGQELIPHDLELIRAGNTLIWH